MLNNLRCYKQLPIWTIDTLPQMFQEQHNTKEGTWAKLEILQGQLQFDLLNEAGEVLESHIFTSTQQPPMLEPQVWHKVKALSDDLKCQLSFYCQDEEYYAKKYNLTKTHSEVLNAVNYIQSGKVLDLGCGRGRNSLYLDLLGFEIDAWDHNQESLDFLKRVIEQEQLQNIRTRQYDINQADIQENYDLIISTVVMMFLQRERIPAIITNMQQHTNIGGYNLIVCAMDTQDYPCPMPFSFTFKENELKEYYQGWEIIKYNEDVGQLHKLDENGNRIQLRFATLLAKKTA